MFDLPDAILLPVCGHLLLVFFLFAMVSLRRQQAAGSGDIRIDDLAHKSHEPERSRRWANNLNNQFELPLMFYALIALLYATGTVTQLQVLLAWLFFGGRVLHTFVQVTGDNVRLRGAVFTVNFLAIGAMWAVFIYSRWSAA